MITLSVNGVENYVASGDCVTPEMQETLCKLGFIDLRNEAQRWTLDEVNHARKYWQDEQLSILSTLRKVNSSDRTWAWSQSKKHAPKIGDLKGVYYDTEYVNWLYARRNENEYSCIRFDKINALDKQVCSVRSQGRDLYLHLLSVLFTSNPRELFEALFPFGTINDALEKHGKNYFDIAPIFDPVFNIFDRVNGRGEILSLFLFADTNWCRGVGYHDVNCDNGTTFHVKELQNGSVRLGKSSYSTCKVCEKLVELSKLNDFINVGRCDVRNSLTKGVIEANKELFVKEFGDFEKALHEEMLSAESDTTGVIFYKNNKCYPRLMNDCIVDCASKGDFKILPKVKILED
jgi:hypothetical protein